MREESQSLLYFAYGEHMNEQEMKRDFPGARMVGLARLDGFALCFIGRDGQAHAALERQSGASVPGRVWALPASDSDALERIVAASHMVRREIHSVSLDGMTLPVLVYIATPGQSYGRPGFVPYDLMREAYEAAGEETETIRMLAMKSAR